MKKLLSAILILTLILGCVFALSACKKDDKDDETENGRLDGTYVHTNNDTYAFSYELTYKFEGNKVTAIMRTPEGTETMEGTYVVNEAGDTITFTVVEDGETETFDCDFAEGNGYIMVNDDKFIKQ